MGIVGHTEVFRSSLLTSPKDGTCGLHRARQQAGCSGQNAHVPVMPPRSWKNPVCPLWSPGQSSAAIPGPQLLQARSGDRGGLCLECLIAFALFCLPRVPLVSAVTFPHHRLGRRNDWVPGDWHFSSLSCLTSLWVRCAWCRAAWETQGRPAEVPPCMCGLCPHGRSAPGRPPQTACA